MYLKSFIARLFLKLVIKYCFTTLIKLFRSYLNNFLKGLLLKVDESLKNQSLSFVKSPKINMTIFKFLLRIKKRLKKSLVKGRNDLIAHLINFL